MIWKPHTTVAAVIEQNGKFLMVEEKIEDRIVINQPAGHLDPNESLLEAVIRETREETAWRFQPQAVTGIYRWHNAKNNRTYLRATFCGICDDHRPEQKLDHGIVRSVWLSHEELKAMPTKLRSPMVMRCIEDYLSGQRYPLNLLVDL